MNQIRTLVVVAVVALWSVSAVSAQELFKRDTDKKKQTTEKTESQQTAKTAAKDTTAANSAGKGNYVAGDGGWVKVEGSSAKATFQLPKEPKYKTISFSPIADRKAITTHMYISVIDKDQSVVVSWHDLHDEPMGFNEIKETLDGAVKGNVARVVGRLDRMESIKVDGHEGREFDYSFSMKVSNTEEKILRATSRIILVGQRQFQIQMITSDGHQDAAAVKKAFDSFTLEK